MKYVVLVLLLLISCAANAQNILWGASFGSYTDSHLVTELPIGVAVAANQKNIATVIINTSTIPNTNLVIPVSSWIEVINRGRLGTSNYYDLVIRNGEDNPIFNRKGYFYTKSDDNASPQSHEFIQASADITVVEGASFSHSKKRANTVLSAFSANNLTYNINSALSQPLPEVLNGLTVWTSYKSSSSGNKIAPTQSQLFFISHNQVNFIQKPTQVDTVRSEICYWIVDSYGNVHSYISKTSDYGGNFYQSPIASIFTKDASGQGVPAMYLQICDNIGCTNEELNPVPQSQTTIKIGNNYWEPINVNRPNKSVFINLYVTGLRIKNTNTVADYPDRSDVQVLLDGNVLYPSFIGDSGYSGVEQVQFQIPNSFSGNPRAIRVKIRTKYLDSFFKGQLEWSSELPDFEDSGDIRNLVYIPIK